MIRISLLALVTVAVGCNHNGSPEPTPVGLDNEPSADHLASYAPWGEVVQSPGVAERTKQRPQDLPEVELERVTTMVPWPRGLTIVDDKLVVLARGRHRRAGGVTADVQDHAGSLFEVDPNITEPVTPGKPAGEAIQRNGRIIAKPSADTFSLWDKKTIPAQDFEMDRPYCTLVYDPGTTNFFICGYSGVDLPGAKFRKNATDSVHRYDRRTSKWYPVERHNPAIVPNVVDRYVVPNQYFPHHDPATNPPPHGWANGADGGEIVGKFLYVAAKDNHCLIQYDLSEIRKNPAAPPPPSKKVLGDVIDLKIDGVVRPFRVLGHSAGAYRDGYLYLAFRTSSLVIRVPVTEEGDIKKPVVAELIAEFQPFDAGTRKTANLIDIAFNNKGELFVACASRGRIWKVGQPDPAHVFDGNDARKDDPTPNRPYVDLRALTGKPKARVGNIVFDDQDRLFLCSGNYDTDTRIAGVIYRVVEKQ